MKFILYMSLPTLMLWSCGSAEKTETPQSDERGDIVTLTENQVRNASLETGIPELKRGTATLSLRGQMEAPPQNLITLAFPMGGYVRDIFIMSGMTVKKGQVLAILEDPKFVQLQQDYLISRARWMQLQAEFERQEALSKIQASSEKQAELAKMERDSERITLKALEQKLKLIGIQPEKLTAENITSSVSVKSPADGSVVRVFGNKGKYLPESEPLVEMIDPGMLYLTLRVFESDLDKVGMGSKVEAFTNSDPSRRYEGEVVALGSAVLPDKSVEVRCRLKNVGPALIPGMYMNAEIKSVSEPAFALPDGAIVGDAINSFIFIEVSENSFELIPVKVVWQEGGITGVHRKDGKPLDGKVVLKNAYTLYMQLKNTAE